MINYAYEYQKPNNTATLDQYIACQSNTSICHANLCYTELVKNIKLPIYDVVHNYMREIRDEFVSSVALSDEEFEKYKYRPKLLCYDIYGNGELAFIILLINDMYSVKQFTSKKLKLPTKEMMDNLVKYIYNSDKTYIDEYWQDNK